MPVERGDAVGGRRPRDGPTRAGLPRSPPTPAAQSRRAGTRPGHRRRLRFAQFLHTPPAGAPRSDRMRKVLFTAQGGGHAPHAVTSPPTPQGGGRIR